jgi:asparagine synthase (glutamine-hydrolysing)
MCGIAGAFARDPRSDVGPLVERLTNALAHRGPDGSGQQFVWQRAAALGHRRLSIVDLAGGAQPMANEDGQVWVVLNGELYNHVVLRRELEALGHQFRTRADTEVLVHGWEEWGTEVLGRLNGMYAFALYDGRTAGRPGTLVLARDPVGVKPLYVGVSQDTWWFASELGAARACGLVGSGYRPEAFDEYLVYRFVPSPGTFYANAWKVPPGHIVRLELDRLPQRPHFAPVTIGFAPATVPRSAGEWQEALRSALGAAVRRQLMSDVPVGSLLSGGVDSTVVTRLMQDGLAEPPQAFAIGFEGRTAPDERAVARRAAAALNVPLEEVAVSEDAYLAAWPQQIAALGEPIANVGLLLVGLLCRTVRRSCKVVLTGQGADEALGGYPRHVAERFYPWARPFARVIGALPEPASERLARVRRLVTAANEGRRFAETLAVFAPTDAVAVTGHPLDPDALVAPVRRALALENGTDSLNRLLRVDARLSLADDLLIVADHTSMASSVELRVPFLDLEFLALVERMPSRYKVSQLGERKWLYRRAVTPLLPDAVRAALTGWRARTGRKLGFSAPVDRWFGRWVHREAEAYLLGPEARTPDFLRPGPIRQLLTAVRDRQLPRARQLIGLYVLESWLRGPADATARA